MPYKRLDWLMLRHSTKDLKGNDRPKTPAQLIVFVSQMSYCVETEKALDKGGYKALAEYQEKQLSDLNDLVLITRQKLSKADRQRIMVMITLDAHNRDILQELVLRKSRVKLKKL